GIIREGLAFDRCDVAVVTNLGEGDHLELRGIDTLDELAKVKTTVVQAVSPSGVAVLKAEDERVAAMATECRGQVIWFSRDSEHPRILRQREQGGRALFVREGAVILLSGGVEEPLLYLPRIPITYGGRVGFQVENTLAVIGAVWALGLSIDSMRYGLESFAGDPDQMPARFNVWEVGGATVVVDFPHNAMALEALVESAEQIAHERRVIVFAGCNRRDADVIRQGEILGDGFDRVILYEDQGNQDRQDGELNALLRQGFAGRGRAKELIEVVGELEAIELALRGLRPGDLLILGVERIEASLDFIRQYLATTNSIER
ncbi:glutamate ligase domain-containing protein, partial [Singulisphaera rosea]